MKERTSTAAGKAVKTMTFLLLLAAIGACLGVLAQERVLGGGLPLHYGIRVLTVVLGLVLWFRTQAMIASRPAMDSGIGDAVHTLTAPVHRYLLAHPRLADGILIGSSAVIDAMGLFVLSWSILGPSVRPFAALMILFILRQICQGTCALPTPPGMIWRNPGFPSLLVTYDVGNDFFFSGHTSLAMLGAIELGRISPWLGVVGGLIALGEALVVIILRAHYTMDVLAAAAVTWCAVSLSDRLFALF